MQPAAIDLRFIDYNNVTSFVGLDVPISRLSLPCRTVGSVLRKFDGLCSQTKPPRGLSPRSPLSRKRPNKKPTWLSVIP